VDGLWATKSKGVGLIVRAVSFQVYNLCNHNPPTLQMDDMRSQYRALHYSASHCKKSTRITGPNIDRGLQLCRVDILATCMSMHVCVFAGFCGEDKEFCLEIFRAKRSKRSSFSCC